MTMRFSAPLQQALFEMLSESPALTMIAGRVYDDAPHRRGAGSEVFVTLGDERVTPWNTATETGAAHEVEIRVHGPVRGFLPVKTVAAAITTVIEETPPAPAAGVVVSHEFLGARTVREADGAARRIDLKFRITVEDDAT